MASKGAVDISSVPPDLPVVRLPVPKLAVQGRYNQNLFLGVLPRFLQGIAERPLALQLQRDPACQRPFTAVTGVQELSREREITGFGVVSSRTSKPVLRGMALQRSAWTRRGCANFRKKRELAASRHFDQRFAFSKRGFLFLKHSRN
jgi:hypothetical protein